MKTTLRRGGLVVCSLLLAAACATKPPAQPMEAPHWSEVPRSAIDAFCGRFHDEGISPQIAINVVRTTQPLVTSATLRGLAEAAFFSGKIDATKVAAAVAAGDASMPVTVPSGGACTWRPIDASAQPNAIDSMTLEISAPFVNPFARSSAGLLARLSLAGEGTTWYWLPLAQRGVQSSIGSPIPLGMRY